MTFKEWLDLVDRESQGSTTAYFIYCKKVDNLSPFVEQEEAWHNYINARNRFKQAIESVKSIMTQDAENWGNALNAAGWEATDVYNRCFVGVKPEHMHNVFFNSAKTIIRASILKYLEKLS